MHYYVSYIQDIIGVLIINEKLKDGMDIMMLSVNILDRECG